MENVIGAMGSELEVQQDQLVSSINASRGLRLYCKMANASLKRAVGGPNQPEGRPYHGQPGSRVMLSAL